VSRNLIRTVHCIFCLRIVAASRFWKAAYLIRSRSLAAEFSQQVSGVSTESPVIMPAVMPCPQPLSEPRLQVASGLAMSGLFVWPSDHHGVSSSFGIMTPWPFLSLITPPPAPAGPKLRLVSAVEYRMRCRRLSIVVACQSEAQTGATTLRPLVGSDCVLI
jgi:hypothetical protein